ncbi:uncharacterized protein LOC129768764 [Toxorhynchites rutilus septentrionalis]|uniref:uncharacterized protein LOC129768764 n=1 Tax=Toxorhynchites rutilus septentrionalis TaxID=329112 RepID=UPI00247A7A64|nr:uncharacterized protein LOC129768764 [Toxorhynchites rutilus septentrionalis]
MGCCLDIKFHGYFIGALAGLLELISLAISCYALLCYSDSSDSELPVDLQDLVSSSIVDYAGDAFILIAVTLLIYGIYKENRYCLIPFMVTICFDWSSYLAHNIDRSMPYHVWLLITAFFLYVFVTMLSLFILFGMKIETPKSTQAKYFSSKFSGVDVV